MTHQDPYVSTETLRQLCQQPISAPRPEPAPPLNDREAVAPELDSIKIDAKRIGILLVNIPLWKLTVFFFRVFLAIFCASIIYAAWWFVVYVLLTANGLVFTNLLANYVHRYYN